MKKRKDPTNETSRKAKIMEKSGGFCRQDLRAKQLVSEGGKFGLTSQIRRAAVSVPANIAEGAARQSHKEFVHFLSNAQGSASELSTELLIARRLGYLSQLDYQEGNDELDNIGRMIVGLSQTVKAGTR